MRRTRTALAGLAALAALVLILVGIPAALWALRGNPLPSGVPTWPEMAGALTRPDDGALVLAGLTLAGWIAWASFAISILIQIPAQARGVTPPRIPGLGWQQDHAAALVGAAAALFLLTGTADLATAPAPAVAATAPLPAATQMGTSGEHDPAAGTGTAPGEREERQVTVRPGDTLWGIAQVELGDGARYRELFDATRGLVQPDGRTLTDAERIYPGWQISIPVKPPDGTTVIRGHAPQSDTTGGLIEAGEAAADEAGGTPSSTRAPVSPRATSPARPTPPPPPPEGERTTTPNPTRTTADPAGIHGEASHDEAAEVARAPWMLPGLTGAGVLLAAALMLSLRRRRAAQARARRPGRAMPAPPTELAPVEKTVMTLGGLAAPTLAWIDEALRRMSATQVQTGQPVPRVVAVELTEITMALHLSEPATLTVPWQASPDRYCWTIDRDTALQGVGPDVTDQPAPYPLLVTAGEADTAGTWLLNLEDHTARVTGDPGLGRDLVRHMAAEIACHPWAHGVRADLAGIAEETAGMNPDWCRIPDPDTDPAEEALAHAIATADRLTDTGTDMATARARQTGADPWPARALLVDPASQHTPALGELRRVLREHPGRTGTGVIVLDEHGGPGDTAEGMGDGAVDEMVLDVDPRGVLTIPSLGLTLTAVGLSASEALGCAAILAHADDEQDMPVPVDEEAAEGWRAWSDTQGAIRSEHTLPRDTPAEELTEPVTSLLDLADEAYLAAAPTTRDDLNTLAPQVPASVAAQVNAADRTLDEDLQAWWSLDCPLPRLSLLGPVTARARGTPPRKRKAYLTELLAYLALREHGTTPDELAAAFTISPTKARDYARITRDWLGPNPRTGQMHLPDARTAPAARARGVGVYQVIDVLVDVDLFRRLRVRGETRGSDGIDDLAAALKLVRGRPFDQLRPGGWSWLFEGDRIDHHMLCAIVDVAHLITTYSLQAGDLKRARWAAETAAKAAPDEDTPRLDLAAVVAAEGHTSEAQRILREEVCNRTDDHDMPHELPERTRAILERKPWQERTRDET